MAFVVEYNKHL